MPLAQFVVGSSPVTAASKPHAVHDVHVWIIDVSSVGGDWIRRRYGLNDEERAIAERFRSAWDASRFVVRRGALRMILGAMADCDPAEIQFGHGPHGKPRAILPTPIDLRFSSTSSHNLILIAASVGLELGIDVEHIVPIFDFSEIARNFFSACERSTLDTLPASLKLRGFYRVWTSREAILKALGIGLSDDFAGISVEADPRQTQDLLFGESQILWRLCAFDTLPDYMAALVVPAACRRMIMHRWCPSGAPGPDDQPPEETI